MRTDTGGKRRLVIPSVLFVENLLPVRGKRFALGEDRIHLSGRRDKTHRIHLTPLVLAGVWFDPHLIEQLLGEMGERSDDGITLAEFFRQVDETGLIPVSLIRWQLTGQGDQIRDLMQ